MTATEPIPVTSIARLFKMAFDGGDLNSLRRSCSNASKATLSDAAAWLDLSIVEQLLGNQASGLVCQSEALKIQRLYRSSWPASRNALRVLAFMTDGDVSTNTPLDFLLENSDVVLYSLYLAPGSPIPDELPEHDVAIVAISDSDRSCQYAWGD